MEVPCVTINKVCGSALKAVTLGAQMIKAGWLGKKSGRGFYKYD